MKYVLGKRVGSTGQAEVYQMLSKEKLGVFLGVLTKNEDQIESAAQAAQALKSFTHANIVRYIEDFSFQTDVGKVHVLVLENCEGGTLRTFMNSKKADHTVIWQYFSDIIDGLVEIHSNE